jgi:hypothetical protein
MTGRTISHAEAAELLGRWLERRLPAPMDGGHLSTDMDEPCDGLCLWIAEDIERDLSAVPAELLRHLKARLLFAIMAAWTRPTEIIGQTKHQMDDDGVVALLLATLVRETRIPVEGRLQ